MRASLNPVVCLMGLFLGKMIQITDLISVHQVRRFVSVNVGGKVTLQCFYQADDSAWFFWYKQVLGQKPKLISSFYVYDTKITFYNEFKNDLRFTLVALGSTYNLTISDLHISDSAAYYCANSYTFVLTFAEGTIINVKGEDLKIQPLVHHSGLETIQPGGSVTLNCTVQTGTCNGERRVYWFKDTGESHPGVIYGASNDQCEMKTKAQTQTHSCVYSLSLKSLNRSHAGTYYCCVVSCGIILFGNGTKVDVMNEVNFHSSVVYYLSGALTFTSTLAVLLAVSVYKKIKRNNCQCTESLARLSAPFTNNAEGYQDTNNIHYAALSVNLPQRPRRQKDMTTSECVYSSVKQ